MMEYNFSVKCVNRIMMPEKHVLICEDDIHQQVRIATLFEKLFGPQHRVQITLCPGSIMGIAVMHMCGADVVLLDHDMPFGSGVDFLRTLNEIKTSLADDAAKQKFSPVVFTFSGIPSNNDRLMEAGAHHNFQKDALINGAANDLLFKYLGAP